MVRIEVNSQIQIDSLFTSLISECRIERSSKMFSTSISHSEKSYAEHLESIQREGVRFGQPTHFSHPHLLKQNELATGVLPTEFASRRRRLMEKIQENCHMNNQTHRNIVKLDVFFFKFTI